MSATVQTPRPPTLSPEIAARLKHVRVGPEPIDLRLFPDFLLVGPQRTGTSWLYANLRLHPQIGVSEPKEVHFFNRLTRRDSPQFESDELGWYLRHFRVSRGERMRRIVRVALQHGELYRPRIRGEATASYSVLQRDVIEEIVALNPQIKALFFIRDPVERAWSHAKKDLMRAHGQTDASDETLHTFWTYPYMIQCAQYTDNIDRWSECLKPGHVFVGFFDDICTRPRRVLLDALEFLGVKQSTRYFGKLPEQQVNPTSPSEIPERHQRFLEELLHEEISKLHARYPMQSAGPLRKI